MVDVDIDTAREDDLSTLAELWLEAFPREFTHLMGPAAERLVPAWLQQVPHIYSGTYLARAGTAVAGYIQVNTRESYPGAKGALTLFSIARRHLGGIKALGCLARLAFSEFRTPAENELFVKMLGVNRGWRRQGIGELLLQHAESHARTLALRKLCIGVVVDNVPAIRLYERFGFVRESEHAFLTRWSSGSPGYYILVKKL